MTQIPSPVVRVRVRFASTQQRDRSGQRKTNGESINAIVKEPVTGTRRRVLAGPRVFG